MQILPHHIHVWSADLAITPAQADSLQRLLSPDENERLHPIRLSTQRQRFVAARGMLRQILSIYLAIPPEQIQLAYGEHKKPHLNNTHASPIQFNLTHSGDVALYAIAHSIPVGIDIEKTETTYNPDIAKRYFSPTENAAIAKLPKNEQAKAFYTIWSRKEALIKAIGKGLTMPLTSFSVTANDISEDIVLNDTTWALTSLSLYPEFASALATKSPINTISYWRLTSDGYIMIKP